MEDHRTVTENEWHTCRFCSTYVKDGYETDGRRHFLSDCRPDLVAHEPGPTCTWHGLTHRDGNPAHSPDCYAYQEHFIDDVDE